MTTYKTIFWIAFAASLILFFTPIRADVGGGYGLDKDVHAAIFAAMVYSGMRAFSDKKTLAVVCLAVYAYAVEYVQGKYFPLRHFDWLDITADIVGLIIGLIFYAIFTYRTGGK